MKEGKQKESRKKCKEGWEGGTEKSGRNKERWRKGEREGRKGAQRKERLMKGQRKLHLWHVTSVFLFITLKVIYMNQIP